eukprot:TRINITY_DN1151_c0_g2_i1.p1 TRINITY_DN1151_c0_g2~~TRINITY_DN1151_c0_g2_i1.p1  ORF type:complete len:446 (+),score=99.84 TRINITY_DN1151_c0_g2_i1:74-1411(+)
MEQFAWQRPRPEAVAGEGHVVETEDDDSDGPPPLVDSGSDCELAGTTKQPASAWTLRKPECKGAGTLEVEVGRAQPRRRQPQPSWRAGRQRTQSTEVGARRPCARAEPASEGRPWTEEVASRSSAPPALQSVPLCSNTSVLLGGLLRGAEMRAGSLLPTSPACMMAELPFARPAPESGPAGVGWFAEAEVATPGDDEPPVLVDPGCDGEVDGTKCAAFTSSPCGSPTCELPALIDCDPPVLRMVLFFKSKEQYSVLCGGETGAKGALFAAAAGVPEQEAVVARLLEVCDVKRMHARRQDGHFVPGYHDVIAEVRLRESVAERSGQAKTSCSRQPPPEGEECLWVAAGSQKPSSKHYHAGCCRDGESDGSGPPPQAASCRILRMLGVASHKHKKSKKVADLGRLVWKAREGPPGAARFALPQKCLDAERMVARLGNSSVKVVALWC